MSEVSSKMQNLGREFKWADPFYIYVAGMSLALILPVALLAFGIEEASVRNWQIAATVAALVAIWWTGSGAGSFTGDGETPGLRALIYGSSLNAFCAATWLSYWNFSVGGFNFSIFDLMLHNTASGRFMYTPLCDCNHFSIHLNWILLPLVPVYKAVSTPHLLLALHGGVIWLSGFPLERIARRHLKSARLSLVVLVAYYGNCWIGSIVGYPFQPEIFYLLCGLWLVEGWESEKPGVWLPAAMAMALVKEEAGVYVLGFALGQTIFGASQRRLAAGFLAAFGAAAFLVNAKLVLPLFRGEDVASYMQYWTHYGHGFREILQAFVTEPHRVIGDVLTSRVPVLLGMALFLPLLSARAMLAMAPSLLILGTSSKESMRNLALYHSAACLPFLFWGLIRSFRLREKLPQKGRRGFVALYLLALFLFPLIGRGYIRYENPDFARSSALDELTGTLPRDGIYCVQTALIPHMPYDLTVRKLSIRCLRDGGVGIANLTVNPYPLSNARLEQLVEAHGARKQGSKSGFVILKWSASH